MLLFWNLNTGVAKKGMWGHHGICLFNNNNNNKEAPCRWFKKENWQFLPRNAGKLLFLVWYPRLGMVCGYGVNFWF